MKLEKEIILEKREAKKIERKSEECDKRELEVNNERNYKEAQKEAKAQQKAMKKLENEKFEEKREERKINK
ncbi:hypothetical protein PN290_08255 [Romboutsia sp. 1001216sp1]|uniref:hypothetical protein n=1 Tax=unclassified Romboutsia TaxID=2626894 RepID=UPI0018AAA3C8|nr:MULTISPECIES: hypothetical protein [unclassified Romboutsia]MDB8793083.1 hypothetical protein [Romboutsia sp. 1001216sp1]MDB8795876.1 hypothetical protein [Romboutsia sp. 1001216sp1]MDB8799371.1 hypothetical protein [Romboutsia sp. 1001216sp1]